MELDNEFIIRNGKVYKPEVFFALCFLTFGLYAIWWNYRVWRFFKEKEDLNILPAARALFSLFFIYSLLSKINAEAVKKGGQKVSYGLYAAFFIITSLFAYLVGRVFPDSMVIFFFPYYIFLIPSVKQLNFYWESEASEIVPRVMSTGAKIALIIGSIFWLLFLAAFISLQF
ncbi:MAG: hypothetical protein EAZ32_12710 [Cytophagia bacterium]|jgi:hypothetical protein|nr:MAG: hypothetical protein EAZ38_13365 [Cytophagales bacterium]TAG38333.1 MAG: hypothetical protein EAZ32_12710 [Cytophagia bacterium]TAG79889.1 MAG: hypothetical protein EAZ22_10635 [Cytophagales bacterium]